MPTPRRRRPKPEFIEREPNETRARYLMRVAVQFIRRNDLDGYTVHFDGAECDGSCLCDDLQTEIDGMEPEPAPVPPVTPEPPAGGEHCRV